MKEQSRYLHSLGLATFPLVPRGKNPHIAGGFKNATLDDAVTDSWYAKDPNDNIGIACGRASGDLVVIDLDVKPDKGIDGTDTLHDWESEHGELPETVTALSGNGGTHLYYRCAGVVINSSQDKPGQKQGVDIRATGGYIVAPPSIHPDTGRRYEWENHPEDYPIADADANVMAFIERIQQWGDAPPSQGGGGAGEKFALPDVVPDGQRNQTIFKLACSMQARGMDDAMIASIIDSVNKTRCNPPLTDDELGRIVSSAIKHAKGKATISKGIDVSLMIVSGKVQQTIDNAARVLEGDDRLMGRFRYNSVSYTKIVTLPLPWEDGAGERPITDADYCGLAAYLEREYGLVYKNKAIDAVTNVSMANRYNPLTDWLGALEWDGEGRIDTLLPCFLGCDPSDYNIAVMRLFMQGAVSRAFSPGTKFDYMPVFIGKQGLGKSVFLRKLFMRSEWFCDNFNTVEGDAASEKLRGMWGVELAELLATKRQKDVESIKAFLTSTVDTFRPKYGRETEQRPRMCVFAGTTNNPHFLTDKTGNRRFLPVECNGGAPMSLFGEGAADYFEQAWAEAVHVYKADHPALVLKDDLQKYAMEKQKDYLEDDPRSGLIQKYLDGIEMDAKVCVAEICERALNMPPSEYQNKRSLSNEIHAIMRNDIEGWKPMKHKQRTSYGGQKCYERDFVKDTE